jgi:hypothetical protein
MELRRTCILAVVMALSSLPAPDAESADELAEYLHYHQVITLTEQMVGNAEAQSLASRYGLQILNITWEDTGRFKGSAVGPNISDMTIQVQELDPRNEQFALHLMPVIRFPNFSDRTADLDPDRFYLLVGNEKGQPLHRVTLTELLGNLRAYLNEPDSWAGGRQSLLADRDSHVLVSAQACFLPIPRQGEATFNPVLFNYQSYAGDPAVLTLLATREGTSVTVIDNQRDGFQAGHTWGQRLFFNQSGERASLTGQRLSDFVAEETTEARNDATITTEAAGETGLNMVLLVQVPLKQKRPLQQLGYVMEDAMFAAPMERSADSDVEDAVIGHGKVEGPFTEIDHLEIERDPDCPIRVTVQFYKATSNGVVSAADMAEIAGQIERVYSEADYVGSLVVEGETGRPTEHDGPKFEPPDWWEKFWQRYQDNLGLSPEEAIRQLRELHGQGYTPESEAELLRKIRIGILEKQED